jgi:hypothetical protein
MSELTISRSFRSLARPVTTRIPSEQTFWLVVRSEVAGSKTLEICNGTASGIRFSSLPDRAGIFKMTFPTVFSLIAPGLDGAKKLQAATKSSPAMFL